MLDLADSDEDASTSQAASRLEVSSAAYEPRCVVTAPSLLLMFGMP